jgi:hypothetical protein
MGHPAPGIVLAVENLQFQAAGEITLSQHFFALRV